MNSAPTDKDLLILLNEEVPTLPNESLFLNKLITVITRGLTNPVAI